ncbi:nitric oxide reductase activation protein NorD [Magnetococcus sp. PR-3]|uniref:nitric oxide reductase activation protein NorD n=1 Tax=Magnetococcus sp. PR-3 TaxID=3120355 RepID=UPI002FCE5949
MEETIGKLWDRIITRAASDRHPEAVVHLKDMERPIGMLFRALGGTHGLAIRGVQDQNHGAKRNFRQRVGGIGGKAPMAWRDSQSIHLPSLLNLFPTQALNRDLYLWLAALLSYATDRPENEQQWMTQSMQACTHLLKHYPGLEDRYTRLVSAHLHQRGERTIEGQLNQEREQIIHRALATPQEPLTLPQGKTPIWPVPLWPHPTPPIAEANTQPSADPDDEEDIERQDGQEQQEQNSSQQARREEMEESHDGILLYRFESIFSWAEMIKVNRASDEEEDEDRARDAAEDMDEMALSRDGKRVAKGFRFDLDLPSEAEDDLILGPGVKVPEWDYRKNMLIPDHCLMQPMLPKDAEPIALPNKLRSSAKKIQAQMASWRPDGIWLRKQWDGSEPDLDAVQEHRINLKTGGGPAETGLYRDYKRGVRDIACLLLADLSLSTDAWVDDDLRIIDVIRDTLFLFSEALTYTGDPFALYGFSSRRREHVRHLHLKGFTEPYNATVRGRINVIRPGYYTRLGAGIRHSAQLLSKQPANRRLLLILSDGKPNDLDIYEGRYGIEDTRMAIREARQMGLTPFCVTVDRQANSYAPHLFGAQGFRRIAKPESLPTVLPQIYLNLTQ